MMKNLLVSFIIFLLLFCGLQGFSQSEDKRSSDIQKPRPDIKEPWHKKVYLGGGLGASFSSRYTFIDISPLAGYRITDRWHGGIGTTFQYIEDKTWNVSSYIYGGRLFTRYYLFDLPYGKLFGHGEYEHLWIRYEDYPSPNDIYTYRIPGLLVGGGISSAMGRNSNFYVMVLYNFLHSTDPFHPTPYQNPVFRVGFNIGL